MFVPVTCCSAWCWSDVSVRDFLPRPFARVWGRCLFDLHLEVRDPVGSGLMRACAPSSVSVMSKGGTFSLEGVGECEARPSVVTLTPAWGRDHLALDVLRRENAEFLSPWEATLPSVCVEEWGEQLPHIWRYAYLMNRDQRVGRALVMALRVDGVLAGQFTVSHVLRGAMSQGMLGYWLVPAWAGRGLGSLCVALVIDLVIGELGLHRLEVAVQPQNLPSLGVCRRLGLHCEGLRPRFIHVAGAWADHLVFSVDTQSLPEGGVFAAYCERVLS